MYSRLYDDPMLLPLKQESAKPTERYIKHTRYAGPQNNRVRVQNRHRRTTTSKKGDFY